VLLGNGSSTPGYLTLASETRKYRPLSGDGKVTSERFLTGDRFKRVSLPGQSGEWLLYLCRHDDLLVHTSGEMTNPLPIEQRFLVPRRWIEPSCLPPRGDELPPSIPSRADALPPS
jgi:hypothetical protein